ncbi:MAG: hypothetical protein EOP44_04815 [Sphingobacteriaceae bacterium]|nr:MAG: hypothetical protein EOP44_04815 [Sphingobacteriaceae bacterium]
MTLTQASSLNDQADYLNAQDHTFANETLNAVFEGSPKNAVAEDDDDDDYDATLPDPDEEDLYDEDDETFPDADELDKIDDDDDAGVIDDDDLDDDDDKGSVTSGMGSGSFADRPQGRTTGRMTDHEPGSGQ